MPTPARVVACHCAREWDRAMAAKRGGRFQFISLDELAVEEPHLGEIGAAESAQSAFDLRWAEAIVDTALAQLREEAEAHRKAKVYGWRQ
jgi:hypothetical protein